MIKTIVILIITFLVVPIATYYFDEPLTAEQSEILWNCIYICLGVALPIVLSSARLPAIVARWIKCGVSSHCIMPGILRLPVV